MDYDIKFSLKEELIKLQKQLKRESVYKQIFTRLYVELGCPEYEELEQFGITPQETNNPTKETFTKLKQYVQHYQLKISRKSAEEIRGYYQVSNNHKR